MKKIILSFAALAAFTSQAYANPGQCIPTHTVEQAKAIYDHGLLDLQNTLETEYQNAQAEVQAQYSEAQTTLQNKTQIAEEIYQQEVSQIRSELNPGWKLEIEAATTRYNLAVQTAHQEYNEFCNEAALNYGNATELSRINFNHKAVELADTYNRAVCATP